MQDDLTTITQSESPNVDERARSAMDRMRARVARRPGRWRRRMGNRLVAAKRLPEAA